MRTALLRRIPALALVAATTLAPARAQVVAPEADAPAVVTLDEAVQIALVQNHAIQAARLDVEAARSQVRGGWGQLMPRVDLSSAYTRNVVASNPFAGSDAGGLFSTLGFLDWLAYNEDARTDDDPTTMPLPLESFMERRQDGLDAVGAGGGDSSNPFSVPNQFRTTVSVAQPVFDMRAFWGAAGADKYLVPYTRAGVERETQLLVSNVEQAFYTALLAQEQARVVAQSVVRTRATVDEMARRVAVGAAPKFQRLSAEVELANLESQLLAADNQAAAAIDNLKLVAGIPVEQRLRLRGSLEAAETGTYLSVSTDEAVGAALERRPDLRQAQLGIRLNETQIKATRAQFFPTLDATANISYLGNVPDDRSVVTGREGDAFTFDAFDRGFFDGAYWDWDVNVGLSLTWNLFNGFQTRETLRQNRIALEQAELMEARLADAVRAEVALAQRNLRSARQRILAQEQNVERAELNYSFARTRLREGVATPLEEREASELLDQSRLAYLQAMHDYLVARSAFETAIGQPLRTGADIQLTAN